MLGNLGSDEAIKELKTPLKDEFAFVRATAIKVLGKIGTPCLPILAQCLESEDAFVRETATNILNKIRHHQD